MGFTTLRHYVLSLVLAGLLLGGVISLSQAQSPPVEDDPSHIQRLYEEPLAQKVLPAAMTEVPESQPGVDSAPQRGAFGQGWSVATFSRYSVERKEWDIVVVEPGYSSWSTTYPLGSHIEPHLNYDGSQIVFTSVKYNVPRIFKVATKDIGDVSKWIMLAEQSSYPNWSPDGSKIVFQSNRDGQYEIYLMNADGTGLQRLTNDPEYDGQPSFSRDGQYIYFISRRSGGYRVYRMNLDGSQVVQMSTIPYSAYPYADGAHIWFSADGNLDGWQEVWRMELDGSNAKAVHVPPPESDAWVYSTRLGGAYTEIQWVQYGGKWYWKKAKMKPLQPVLWPPFGNNMSIGYDLASRDQTPPVTTLQIPPISTFEVLITPLLRDPGGSGVVRTEVEYRDQAGGDWMPVPEVPAYIAPFVFYGIGGHTYEIRARSIDYGGNVEPWPSTPQAVTTIEALPPRSVFAPISPFQTPNFTWPIGYWDVGGSKIKQVFAEYREVGSATWQPAKVAFYQEQIRFTGGIPGKSYEFRLRAQDRAENLEDWHQYHEPITIYTWGLSGQVYNIAATPLSGVEAHLAQNEAGSVPSDSDGRYTVYGVLGKSQQVRWNRIGQDVVLSRTLNTANSVSGSIQSLNIVFPPLDNVVSNPGFEERWRHWTVSGNYSVTLSNRAHTGDFSLVMGTLPNKAVQQTLIPASNNPSSPRILTDPFDRQHLLWIQDGTQLFHMQKTADGGWSSPQLLYSAANAVSIRRVCTLNNGTIRLILADQAKPYLLVLDRSSAGNVHSISSDVIPRSTWLFASFCDGDNIHIVYNYGQGYLYTRLQPSGTFSSPEPLPPQPQSPSLTDPNGKQQIATADGSLPNVITVDQTGNVYFFWAGYIYKRVAATGTWESPLLVPPAQDPISFRSIRGIFGDALGRLHLFLVYGAPYNRKVHHLYVENGQWSEDWTQAVCAYGAESISFMGPEGAYYFAFHCSQFDQSTLYLVKIGREGNLHIFEPLAVGTCDDLQTGRVVNGNIVIATTTDLYYKGADTGWTRLSPMGNACWWWTDGVNTSIDAQGIPHWWFLGSGASYGFMKYATLALPSEDYTVTVQQRITIPLTMTNPTLSLLLQQHLWPTAPTAYWLPVLTVSGQQTVTPSWNSQPLGDDWTHYWADVSSWVGQTVTVTLHLNGKAGVPTSQMLVDEVFLGSAYPDAWLKWEAPLGASPGQVVRLHLWYGNRGAYHLPDATLQVALPDTLKVIDIQPPSTLTANGILTWTLGTLSASTRAGAEIVARVQAPLHGEQQMVLWAKLLSSAPDENPDDNQSMVVLDFKDRVFLPAIWRGY